LNAALAASAEKPGAACSADSGLIGVGPGLNVAGCVGIMTIARQQLGKTGEDLACRALERRGYAIVARRYRRRGGELDIIARDGATLVFVEVKARDGRAFGDAAAAVTAFKRRRITQLARDYITRHHLDTCPCRFDVVSIQFESGEPAIEIIQNAFDA
jgi:putative endonuclease